MFKQFYKDIDTLHQLVKPFIYTYGMNKMTEAWQGLADSIGSLIVPLTIASIESKKLVETLKEYQVSD